MILNEYEEIVTNFKSPTVVIAPPGSGKTYLLADRTKRLLDSGVNKNSITILTFGKDARQSMYDKLIDRNGHFQVPKQNLPNISTMHSLGLKIVQDKPNAVNLKKTTLKVQPNEYLRELMFRDASYILGLSEKERKEAMDCKQFGDCKENIDDDKCKVCFKYWEIMSKCNCIDFDDQILFACKILEGNPYILEEYQNSTKHLLIDEYQDINSAQFRMIELLTRKFRNGLFVVGDDAQNIYGFRGTKPKFILDFNEFFPGAQSATLPNSRRCPENIMNDAFNVLEKYYPDWSGRPELKYHTQNEDQAKIYFFPSESKEAEYVARAVKYYLEEKKSVLVMAPKKDFFPIIIEELKKKGASYNCSINLLPESLEKIKCYLEWLNNSSDSLLTRLIIEYLIDDGIAKVPGGKKRKNLRQDTIEKRIKIEKKIAELWNLVDKKNDLFKVISELDRPNEIFVKIREGLANLINLYRKTSGNDIGEFVKQFSLLTGIWSKPAKFTEDILKVTKLLQTEDTWSTNVAQLKTMRKAKGLQSDIVILVGLEDDIIPNPKNNIEEEARIFYVSMTRATEKLYLFHSSKRPRNISYGDQLLKKNRSQFLNTIGRESLWEGLPKEK